MFFLPNCDKRPSATCFCRPMWLFNRWQLIGAHYALYFDKFIACILTGTSARIAIASETEKKTRGVYISFQPSMAFCSGENNLALLQDKLDSIKLLNEKTEHFFTIAFASARKPYRMALLFTHKNGDFGSDYALELHFWLTKRFTRTHKWRACSQATRTLDLK